MAAPSKVTKFLEKSGIKYELVKHRKVFTAYDKSATLKVPLKIVGKTLVVKLDKDFALVLIPANRNLDKVKFKKTINGWKKKRGEKAVKNIDFAREAWIKNNLKGVKVGAVPPLGSLWKLLVFIDVSLLRAPKIFINAGDFNWSIKIKGAGLKKLAPDLFAGSFGKAK